MTCRTSTHTAHTQINVTASQPDLWVSRCRPDGASYSRTSAPRSSLDLCMQVTLLAGVIVRTQPSHSLCVTRYTPSTTPRMYTTCARSTTTPHGPSLRSRTTVRRSVTAGRCRAGMGAVRGAVIVATATVVTDSHFSLDLFSALHHTAQRISAQSRSQLLPTRRGQRKSHKRRQDQSRPAHTPRTARWRHRTHPCATAAPRYSVHALHGLQI